MTASSLDDFAVLGELGRGSSSVVHLAHQASLDREVALKRLLRVLSGDAQAEARLRREAYVIARLEHDRIVRLYDIVLDGADIVLVMQYVRGSSVRSVVRQAGLSPAQALSVVRDVAEALTYAAAGGVIHRDVKPANVFVTDGGRCKLGDFGLAQVTADLLMFRSQHRAARGTPMYMAPEQIRGEDLTSAADVYALSLVAYELLFGQHRFAGLDVGQAFDAHLSGEAGAFETPSAAAGPVCDVLRGGLALDPGDRPGASELAAALIAAAPGRWFTSPGAAPLGRPGQAVATAPPPPLPHDADARPHRGTDATAGSGATTTTGTTAGATSPTDGRGYSSATSADMIVSGARRADDQGGDPLAGVGWVEPLRPPSVQRRGLARFGVPAISIGAFAICFALALVLALLLLGRL